MPHHKSATKRLRTAEKARRRNMGVKSNLRNQLKVQRSAETPAAAAEALSGTHAELDRAAAKGVIPKSRAARLKSRTAKNAAKAS